MLGGILEGNPETTVNSLSKIEEGKPGSLSFLSNINYAHHIYESNASVIIVAKDFFPERPLKKTCTLIRVDHPRAAFAKLLDAYNQFRHHKTGIDKTAIISSGAQIGVQAYVGALSYIGENVIIGKNVKIYQGVVICDNCTVGDDTIIYPGVKIYAESKVGNSCTIHAGVIIGGDGFGFVPNSDHNYAKVPHIGNVLIEDHVEIGCNTTIDRATLGSTVIRKGVKLDNLIQIAHNVEIGENTVIAAQTGIAGSTRIGKNVMIGGQVGIIGHLTIADGVKIAAQSGVGQSITTPGEVVQGSPAFNIGDYKRSYVLFRKLPDLAAHIDELEILLKELKAMQEK